MKSNLPHKQDGFIGYADESRKERLLRLLEVIGTNERKTVELRWPSYHDQERLLTGRDLSDFDANWSQDGPDTILPLSKQLAEYSQFLKIGTPVISAPGGFRDVDLPVIDQSLVAGFGAATAPDIGDSGVTVGLATPRRVSAEIVVSNQLKVQNSVFASAFVESQLLSAIGQSIDNAILNGDGTGDNPTGLLVDSDVLSHTRTTAGINVLSDLAAMERAIADNHGETDPSDYFFVCDTATRENLRTQPGEIPGGTFGDTMLSYKGETAKSGLLSYPTLASKHAPTNTLILAQKQALAVVDWGMLKVSTVPDVDRAIAGFSTLLVEGYMDVLVRDPNGVCKALDA